MSEVVSIIDAIRFGYSSWPVVHIERIKKIKKQRDELACHRRRGWGNFDSQRRTRVLQQLLERHAFVLGLPLG